MSHGHGGVVASGHPCTTRAGLDILGMGGNAIDAAVAAFFASFHAEPLLASPAGAGFMVGLIDGQATAWDFFAVAPGLGTSTEPYVAPQAAFWGEEVDFGSARQVFHIGAGSIAVPGAVAGLCQAQREAGRLTLAQVLEPALALCEAGSPTERMGGFAIRLLEPILRASPDTLPYFLRPDGEIIDQGDWWHNPELGHFYRTLRDAGSEDVFYRGALADLLVETVQRRGGGLTHEDLAAYRVQRTAPLQVDGPRGRLLLAPPPSSGGMLLAYSEMVLGGLPVPPPGSRDDVLLLRASFAETMLARAEVIGDATPSMDHAARLLDGAMVEKGRARLRHLLEHGVGALPTSPTNDLGSTTHLSVIDCDGNAASVTISNGECSGLVLPGHGVLLNNFLGEEDLNPLGFHRFKPGARLGSSMTPMVLQEPSGAVTALGSGGSSRIRTALSQVVRNLRVHHMPPFEAVCADRLHYEPGMLYAEVADRYTGSVPGLRGEGLQAAVFDNKSMYFGGTHLCRREADGAVTGVGDPRRSGASQVERPAP